MEVLVILVVGALLAWTFYLEVDARRTSGTHVTLPPSHVESVVENWCGRTWAKETSSSRSVKVSPRLKARAPTLTVEWRASGGGTEVTLFASHYTTMMMGILILHPLFIWRQKRRLQKYLAQADGALRTEPEK